MRVLLLWASLPLCTGFSPVSATWKTSLRYFIQFTGNCEAS